MNTTTDTKSPSVSVLRDFNKWRRDQCDFIEPPHSAQRIGEAIDDAVRELLATGDTVQANHDKLTLVAAALKHLVEVIEAHEIESLSCDRDGNKYCDCLRNAATGAKRLLPNVQAAPRPL